MSSPEGSGVNGRERGDIITVSGLTGYIKKLLAGDGRLQNLHVRGEISNLYRHSASGHMYFTLKDDRSCIRCVFFRRQNQGLDFAPEDGLAVIASGRVDIYEQRGQYQLYVNHLTPDGVGALYLAFRQLRERLEKEGLFDSQHKLPLPGLPRCVGLITSPRGAAVRDMVSIMRRRHPYLEIVISPATVQGEGAPRSLIRALERLEALGRVEVIVIGRGGGSFESLFCFNDERLARRVFASRIPTVSAVGHETDFTILDYVADLRAPTPSAAAELVVPELEELLQRMDRLERRMMGAVENRLRSYRDRLESLQDRRVLTDPLATLEPLFQRVDELSRAMRMHISHLIEGKRQSLGGVAGKLQTLSPLETLSRGYAIARRPGDGGPIRSVGEVGRGDELEVLLRDGALGCTINSAEEGGFGGGEGSGIRREDQ